MAERREEKRREVKEEKRKKERKKERKTSKGGNFKDPFAEQNEVKYWTRAR